MEKLLLSRVRFFRFVACLLTVLLMLQTLPVSVARAETPQTEPESLISPLAAPNRPQVRSTFTGPLGRPFTFWGISTNQAGAIIHVYIQPGDDVDGEFVPTGEPELLGETVVGDGPSWTWRLDVDLADYADGMYALTATATLNGETSPPSVPTVITWDATPPDAPGNVQAIALDDTHVAVWWEAPEPDIRRYRVYRGNRELTISHTERFYIDRALEPATTYSYTVKAEDLAANFSELSEPAVVTTLPATASDLSFRLITRGHDGGAGHDRSDRPVISADGRFVVFASYAPNLLADDTNQEMDVFLFDVETNSLERISVGRNGEQSNGMSVDPSISADGRYIAFASMASNLVENDTNGQDDIFVRDRLTGTTERINVLPGGIQLNNYSHSPSISDDGRYVAFVSTASNLTPAAHWSGSVYVHDRQENTTTLVSAAPDGTAVRAERPVISGDGRFIAFVTTHALVEDDRNNVMDAYVYELATGQIERVSVSTDGHESNAPAGYPSISQDGQYVLFRAGGHGLVDGETLSGFNVYLRDRTAGTTERLNYSVHGFEPLEHPAPSYEWTPPSLSRDGNHIAVVADGNLYQYDRQADTWSRIGRSPTGGPPNDALGGPAISNNGDFPPFHSLVGEAPFKIF